MSKILVAYFSASGETACLAKTLAGAMAETPRLAGYDTVFVGFPKMEYSL